MKVAIVGAEESKWGTKNFNEKPFFVKRKITQILHQHCEITESTWDYSKVILVSGHCPRGGVDIWAEEVADELGIKKEIYPAPANQWDDKIEITHHNFDNASLTEVRQTLKGFKSRNIQIAEASDVLYCLSPKANSVCIHCKTTGHLKNGGCWTLRYAEKLGKKVVRLVI